MARAGRRRAKALCTRVAVGVVIASAVAASPASAYVRYLSKSGCPYTWHSRSLVIHEYPAGLPELDDVMVNNAATQAAEIWGKRNAVQAACTDLDVQVTTVDLMPKVPDAKFDHTNNLVFRSDTWCPDPTIPCHEPAALAITSVFARTWGEIVDADIEVNAVYFKWADLEMTSEGHGKQDVQNALTHEIGHMIGLDHTCYGDPTRARPLDNHGTSIPDCDDPDLPEEVRASTMFASADPGDTTKRTLEPDDLQAICEIYPRGGPDPLACASPTTAEGGCAIASGSALAGGAEAKYPVWPRALIGGGLMVLAFVVGWRRLRSPRA